MEPNSSLTVHQPSLVAPTPTPCPAFSISAWARRLTPTPGSPASPRPRPLTTTMPIRRTRPRPHPVTLTGIRSIRRPPTAPRPPMHRSHLLTPPTSKRRAPTPAKASACPPCVRSEVNRVYRQHRPRQCHRTPPTSVLTRGLRPSRVRLRTLKGMFLTEPSRCMDTVCPPLVVFPWPDRV